LKSIDWQNLPKRPGAAAGERETQWVLPEKFFDELEAVLADAPPLPGEEARYAQALAVLNAVKDNPALKGPMIDAAKEAEKTLVEPLFEFRNFGIQVAHNWSTVANGAEFGTDNLTRTAVAKSNIADRSACDPVCSWVVTVWRSPSDWFGGHADPSLRPFPGRCGIESQTALPATVAWGCLGGIPRKRRTRMRRFARAPRGSCSSSPSAFVRARNRCLHGQGRRNNQSQVLSGRHVQPREGRGSSEASDLGEPGGVPRAFLAVRPGVHPSWGNSEQDVADRPTVKAPRRIVSTTRPVCDSKVEEPT
jgi:hypothetical protein